MLVLQIAAGVFFGLLAFAAVVVTVLSRSETDVTKGFPPYEPFVPPVGKRWHP